MNYQISDTQLLNQMDIRAQHVSSDSNRRKTSSNSKMEFNPNGKTVPYQFKTLDESSSCGMEVHGETQCFQADFQNRTPVEVLHYPNSSKLTDIRFRETGSYRSIPAAHKTAPSICTNNAPCETTFKRGIQKRMPLYAAGIRSPVDNAPRSHQASSTNGIPYHHHTVNPRETDPKGIPSCAKDIAREIDPYRMGNPVGKRPNGITSYYTGNSREKDRSGITSSRTGNPREIANGIASDQTKSSRQMYPNQTANPDEMYYYAEEERDCGQVRIRRNSQFDQMTRNPLDQTCSKAETSSHQTNRSPGRAPFHQTKFQGEVLTSRADEASNERGNNFRFQTGTRGRMSSYLPFTTQQTSGNVRGLTRTCSLCHCVMATQPQPVSYPTTANLQNTRKSVIMIPLNRGVKKTNETPTMYTARDQEWSATRKTPLENVSYNSEEELDDEEVQERVFRVNIDGTTARFKLTEEDWARMPIKTFPSGGRLLSGDWTRIFLSKVKESNPWCSLRFKNNHVRSENSRKIHSAAFFRGGAECKFPECKVKMRFVIKKEYGRRVDVTYIGNVCHVS